jgi:hypothetical protein
MMKYTPRVRSATVPISAATRPATSAAAGHRSQADTTPASLSATTVYAPTPMKPACPSATMPPKPRTKLRLAAASATMSTRRTKPM